VSSGPFALVPTRCSTQNLLAGVAQERDPGGVLRCASAMTEHRVASPLPLPRALCFAWNLVVASSRSRDRQQSWGASL
jgi:hypothetical protein